MFRIGPEFLRAKIYSRITHHSNESLAGKFNPFANMPFITEEVKPILRFKKMSENAMTPKKGSEKAAGYDLFSAKDVCIPSYGKALIPTDIQIQLPENCYGRIAPRSGLSWKQHLDVGAGVIDEDYRGNVGVVLFNHASSDYDVKKGDRIAQLICEKIFYPELEEVKEDLEETKRGAGGFGSTDQ